MTRHRAGRAGELTSPYFAAGLSDGAADALRNPRVRAGYDPGRAASWMYRRGFSRGFLAVRAMTPAQRQLLQDGLDEAWRLLNLAGPPARTEEITR